MGRLGFLFKFSDNATFFLLNIFVELTNKTQVMYIPRSPHENVFASLHKCHITSYKFEVHFWSWLDLYSTIFRTQLLFISCVHFSHKRNWTRMVIKLSDVIQFNTIDLYHGLRSVSTLTEQIKFFFKKWIHFFNFEIIIFPSYTIILWFE
jgi:hypothetical protein